MSLDEFLLCARQCEVCHTNHLIYFSELSYKVTGIGPIFRRRKLRLRELM